MPRKYNTRPLKEVYEEYYDVPAMKRVYDAGNSLVRTAEQFPITKDTLANVFKYCGIPTRPSPNEKHKRHLENDQEGVIEWYEGGKTLQEIRDRFKMSNSTIYAIIDMNGVDRRRP